MQAGFFQNINALLQQFQHSQSTSNFPPQLASVNPLQQQQLLQAIQAIDQNALQHTALSTLFQSLQQQTPQNPLLSDSLKLIAPVGQSPNDEQLLVMALHSGLSQGFDHRRAIETLHGVNNHAANLWKDYYLEHKSRIDDMVIHLQPIRTAKKPVRFDLEPRAPFTSPELKGKQPKERLANASNLCVPSDPASSRRDFMTHPSGSHPIPNMRNRYTIEDKKYFSKYISWALQADPLLTKSDLIARLAEKVPHHSARSWGAYWARDPLADRLLAAAQGKMIEGYDDEVSEEEASLIDSDEDEAAMGESGSFFGAAEIRVMAKYIAKHSPEEWKEMSNKQRWFPFHEEHPQRSDKAYYEKYRTMEQDFLRLAERYRKRAQRQLEMQRGTPSWVNTMGRPKRRLSLSVDESRGKRALRLRTGL
ncbi:hypothetical protein B0F90DRAFT_1676321 [Multifurca ochricompacta]|uniref:Uncharacterized protein n=1 Tax=Multifurca ochricompacta TaxID=376703 RepID=A0AAD4QTR2_9AGAM|nr:hypothetical protein B0F90DRAFT_1676321 [Multifurca ochricompacta]